jgi:hypothetical protein
MEVSNIESFISICQKHHWSFYHLTDVRNLTSIKEHGLLSTAALRARSIETVTGGNQWSLDADRSKGMDAFIHLCFFNEHPMEYLAKKDGRIKTSKFLLIDPAVLRTPNSLIAKDVSNKADASYGNAEEFIEQVDLKVIYTKTDWKDKAVQDRLRAARKSEILIPEHIPLNFIRNL